MTATNHGLFGAALAITLQKYPAVALAVAPFSHFLVDMIPHFADKATSIKSRRFFTILLIDMIVAVVTTLLIAWMWSDIALLVIGCAFLAASPDLMWLYYQYIRPTPPSGWGKIARFHAWVQWSETKPGLIVEAVWFVFFFGGLTYIGI